MNINKVSQSLLTQAPEFIQTEFPLFNKFLEYYYKSQEKTGLGQNIINNFLTYMDIDRLDVDILDGKTTLAQNIDANTQQIVVESVDKFLENNGTILVGGEVIYYESTTKSPNIALSPGIAYSQVKLKWTDLAPIVDQFDGTTRSFQLVSQDNPIAPPSLNHLIVRNYGEVLIPSVDYTLEGNMITFTEAPRARLASDDVSTTTITYMNGFIENQIVTLDNLAPSFGDGKTIFTLTKDGQSYEPVVDEYVIVVYDDRLNEPKIDYFLDGNKIIFKTAPIVGRSISIRVIEAPIPSFGSGAVGYARVDDNGSLTKISTSETGSNYRFEYPPKISINSEEGQGAAATSLVNGIKDVLLLDGGKGYSDTNPPVVQVEVPTKDGSEVALLKATVTNGSVTGLELESSGSGYTFTPRITFKQPGGATLASPTIVGGSISGSIEVTNVGQGYTTAPQIYIDEPTGSNGIRASLQAILGTDGSITGVTILNAGQGYEQTPRIAIIDPVGAQVLQTVVDNTGRVTNIELLDGGSGYEEIPSVYIVDPSGSGTGATATASIFNGRITDINITNFGSGYSSSTPPNVVIQAPPTARASAEVGLNEVTGFKVFTNGSGYSKASFIGCARGASAITNYDQVGNAEFSNYTSAASATEGTEVKCLDSLFVKRLLDKYTEQYLPDVPELDYKKIDVRTAIKTIKDFYSSKGTEFSLSYIFKLLYGESISVSYPKDQISKPSAATWSIDTILRATLVSGDPINIKDALLVQEADIADSNVGNASALVENYLSIKTSDVEIFELVLSEETISGNFIVPYKTRLAEPLNQTDSIITVDSTIGWPERNGEFLIGGSELVQYKEKSLNQFIECTRSVNDVVEDWDSATEITSNFQVYLNKGTSEEVVMNIVGIVDAQQTTLTDTGSYYLPGDKLSVSKLGGTSDIPQLTTWLYNVKKLVEVDTITFGGVNNQSATVTCSAPHGLLVGDQVTVYGANPIIYNGTFLVTSRDSQTVFQYQLPQPAAVVPQGNILISVDLNKGKSQDQAIQNIIGPYTTNIQNAFFGTNYVYVASTGIPNYDIGPFPGSAILPGNQRKLNRFTLNPTTISTKTNIVSGPIGTWINGVSVWSYRSTEKKTFGAVTGINITNSGTDYDAANPPVLSITGGGGTGAAASVVVDGSLYEVEVLNGGSGYTSSPLVSIVGGGGSGAAATAIITKGVVSRILINQGGSGYTSQPLITIVGGGGTGATATASVRGPIKSVSIDAGGSSYTEKPSVLLSSGSGAVAQAIVNDGRIISAAIISAGSGYTTAPEITIQGDGFGAIARATIDVDGENAGRVTGIEIVNRGIGYTQGMTSIGLTSVGQDATFDAEVFQWNYNLQETTAFDSAKGAVFTGYNVQYGGEYAHLSNPQRLRYIMGDNLFQNTQGTILEQDENLFHSPIIGWAFDGNPIYGPYAYADPTDQSSEIQRMVSSYSLKSELIYNDITNPNPVRSAGPLLSEEPAGKFVEDYQYVFGSGDLDQYNGRFCKTPEYPDGRYCYFITVDATEAGNPVFPYIIGPQYNSVVDSWNLNDDAVQQNIPQGVVRYRDPYENVDIDVERAPNASTNTLTTETGDILSFEIEDENRDGVIRQDEIDDPDAILEESPLQLFDYFPTVKLDSKVDIEVETITKFEDASVTGFTIENTGQNYQVNDRLVFDNTGTEGSGASARVSKIVGESVSSYSYETVDGINYGILQTSNPHNLKAADQVFVDYTPIMANTNKQFIVRQYKGIEEIIVTQNGSGYNTDIPPSIIIDGDGVKGKVEAVVDSVGAIKSFNIVNSGSGYTQNPRVILSHPQVFKKSDYYATLVENQNWSVVKDIAINDSKELYVCGSTYDSNENVVAFLAKLSATGVKEWEKTLETTVPASGTFTEFQRIILEGNNVWVAGINKPNSTVLDAYNPDIIIAKYAEASNGLSATLTWQKGYSGISGSTRSDNITAFKQLSSTRFVLGGFTNTNSGAPWDAFLAILDTSGFFVAKRKLASDNASEKITDIAINNGDIFFSMETAPSQSSNDVNVSFGKATAGVSTISIDWIKEISNTTYSYLNSSICVDEFNEFYIPCTLRLKSDDTTKDSFWVGKFDNTGELIWNKRYLTGDSVEIVDKCSIDIFGDLAVTYTKTNTTTSKKTFNTVKIKYNGDMLTNTENVFNPVTQTSTSNCIEGAIAHTLTTDISGDVYTFGQTKWNRNEVISTFTTDSSDITGHHTPVAIGANGGISYADNSLKILGYATGNPATWDNSYYKVPGTSLVNKLDGDWTLQFFVYKDASNSQTLSQSVQTLVGIGGARDATGGLWLGYDTGGTGKLQMIISNNTTALNAAGSGLTSTLTNMYADNTWQVISLTKQGTLFKAWINGIEVLSGNVTNTSFANKDLYIGNQVGWGATSTDFASTYQGQFYLDHLFLKNRYVAPSVPTDITVLPTAGAFAENFDWVDDAWFTTNLNQYDYIDYTAFGLKTDRNSEASKLGNIGIQTNTQLDFTRTAITPVTPTDLTISNSGYSLGGEGFQSLDFSDATTTHTQDTESMEVSQDTWGSRTATVPSPGSQKVQATAVVKDRYFFKVTNTTKIDNVQRLTINQPFAFTLNSKLVLNNGSSFVNSGYIVDIDYENRYVYLAVNNNSWTNDINVGLLTTERFDEQSTFGIRGPIPNDVNEINDYTFAQVINTTPGTFDIDLADYNAPTEVGGTNNLDEYAYFKTVTDDDYRVRIDEISGSSPYIVGSVVSLSEATVTFNAAYSTINIQGLTGVTKITLISTLSKILQVDAVSNSDIVYVITDNSHYLTPGEVVYVDGNPSQEVSSVVYDEYDGAFFVDTVISVKEFTYKLDSVAVTSPATNASSVSIYVKSPTLKMYYGHQYIFDLSHSSLVGGNLSFSKDSLNKLEYSFNSIERVGTPGVTGGGQPNPTVKLKVDRDIVTNISYYFDPSRLGDDSPVIQGSYLDVVGSPYNGTFTISGISGATITTGADTMRFPLLNEPEGVADITNASYSTSSEAAVGSIADIRIVNKGGFYTKLPIVSGIQSSRKIERIQINEPGTEYAPGQYNNVPILGDGEGGLVNLTVEDTTDAEGNTVPGQITSAIVSSSGKGYTTASIDVASIDGILGSSLAGSGAELQVIIPPFGTGASIFTKGIEVGKIKKLKNNNFGYDYPHDYTLRPEITFPLNCQLTSTSILDSITVTDPGSGYSQAPAVIISGGGGSGATAEATISNGRLDQIIVKDPGSGYSSTPTVGLKSSFNYVVNLDLGLLQFAFPHGIENGAAVTLNVTDTGDGAEFPLASGALGRLNGSTTYYAIAGTAQSLDDDQLRLAITPANAELGDAITFSNAGTGRQQVLTESFGGAAEANVITATFLEGELVYQGPTFETATATGYVSTNSGWQVGPRILKIVDYTGDFVAGQSVNGIISKASGVISDLKVAKGVLEIGSITKTTGQFIDDVGKPSEIIQKIQDSYFYQDFSYAVKSSVSISEWKDVLIKNVHPAGFKVFGELSISDYGFVPNKDTAFELTKSVQLAQEAIVPNIQSFALVEPIYQEFNNTEVLFRQKRLTSSENILTSVVQRIDDISNLFDGERIAFPLQVQGNNVIASSNQLMIILNGVVQTPETSFKVENDSIVFAEPPQPPASVKYAEVTIDQIPQQLYVFFNISGIFPNIGNQMVGVSSDARATVTKVEGDTIQAFVTEGTFQIGELITVSATGFSANLQSVTNVVSNGLFTFNETITNFDGDTAKVEQINLETGQEVPLANLRYGIGTSTTEFEIINVTTTPAPVVNTNIQIGSEIMAINAVQSGSEDNVLILTVIRGQLGTATTGHLQSAPIYGTDINVNNELILSKTAGTYQSTPGLFDIQLNDIIIGAGSGVVARVTSTSAYQDPVTQEFISQVNISDGASFSGLLFNRITTAAYQNVVLDNIAASQISIVDFDDNATAYDSNFPANEIIDNTVIDLTNINGTFQENEFIRNKKIELSNTVSDFIANESASIRKLVHKSTTIGSGFYNPGQIIRNTSSKAEVIGYNQAQKTVYLGKVGRSKTTGEDYHTVTFVAGAYINSYHKKFNVGSLALSAGTTAHTFVSGVTDAITASGGASGSFTAASGTTYDPITGDLVITIGSHSLTTSNTVLIADEGIVFTCAQDNNTSQKAYPRSTDPASGSARNITAVTSTTITVNVGAVPVDEYLSIPTSTEFGFGTSAFTIECWIKPNTVAAGDRYIVDLRANAGETAPKLYLSGSELRFGSAGTNHITGGTLAANTWYHVAVCRSAGGTTKLFLDGVQIGSDYSDSNNYGSTQPVRIGGDTAGTSNFAGFIDEVRISDNARYDTAFTALTTLFQGDANAKLLLHFDGSEGDNHTDDWSGTATWTDGDDFSNDAIRETQRKTGAPSGYVGKTHRYIDASRLLENNKDLLAKEVVAQLVAQYPSLVIPGGNVNCEDDVRDIVEAIVEDLRNGSNTHMWQASALYVDRTSNPVALRHVDTEITETVWAYNKLADLAKDVINNELLTITGSHGLTQFTDTTIYDSNNYGSLAQITPSAATYDPATGLLVLTSTGHSLTTSSRITLTSESLVFTCTEDGNNLQTAYPRVTDPANNAVLAVTATTTDTFTVNVGPSSQDDQYVHTFVSAATNAVTVLDYTSADCADVQNTIDTLIDILTDTLTNANAGTPVDHLATVTEVTPAYEFLGTFVDAYAEVPLTLTNINNSTDIVYTNQFNLDSQYRFRDAATLIRSNRAAIVDKAAADMLARYPYLALSMPRNGDGSGAGTLRCKTDLGLILDGIANDIEEGGNLNTLAAIKLYLGSQGNILHIRLQLTESAYAHTRLGYYAKQAVTGDLDNTNTDAVIIGDWGITNDPGNCANVTSAIDSLIDVANDTLAPTGDRYRDAADLLLKNRDFISDEATLITDADFSYLLGTTTYRAFQYPDGSVNGRANCRDDISDILKSVVADLLTGGNSNTVAAAELYLTASLGITQVEDQILPTIYAFQKVRMLGKKAINNLLYDNGVSVTGDQYSAVYTALNAYRDSTITDSTGDSTYSAADCADVINAFDNLMDLLIDTLTPGDVGARIAGRLMLFNENYYKEEIQNEVQNQWGNAAWTGGEGEGGGTNFDDFITEMLNNSIHDMVTTDASTYITAQSLTLTSITNSFTVGGTVTSSGGGTATILEWYPKLDLLIIGAVTGTAFAAADTLTNGSATATIATNGVSAAFNYISTISNVETLNSAKLIQSTVSGQVSSTNLWTNPEAYEVNWTTANATINANVIAAPDSELTAESIISSTANDNHYIYRDYNLTPFATFDGDDTFDSTTETFDTGSLEPTQTFTISAFIKAKGYDNTRFNVILDPGPNEKDVKFDLDLDNGTVGTVFNTGGVTVDAAGSVPLGNGWYRAYMTLTFSFGISVLRNQIWIKNTAGAQIYAGDGTSGLYVWGAKLSRGAFDPYVSTSGSTFYSDNDFNIKNYVLDSLDGYFEQALNQNLTNPSPLAGFIPYVDGALSSQYDTNTWMSVIRRNFAIIKQQLLDDGYISNVTNRSGIVVPSKTYGTRNVPVGITTRVQASDNIIGLGSGAYGEISNIRDNEAQIVKVYQRFRIDGIVTGEAFVMGEAVTTSGGASGIVYGKFSDENNIFFDVAVSSGTFSVSDTITGGTNSSTAVIAAIENRIQVIKRKGTFDTNIEFKGFTSGATADVGEFHLAEASVLDNSGGKLTVDTQTLTGNFEVTSVVYPSESSEYLKVNRFEGLDIQVGDRIASDGYVRLLIAVSGGLNQFSIGDNLNRVVSGEKDPNNVGIITDVDLDNNYLYVSIVRGDLTNGNTVGSFDAENVAVGLATVGAKVVVAGAGAALVQDIQDDGIYKRLYLTDVAGSFTTRDTIRSVDNYRAAVLDRKVLRARVRRFFKGFDGTQTNFKLTTNNGDPYFPDPAGHMLIFVNGILQPPGATNAYTAFSDQIAFTEPPELGSSFTGFYVGKLRQLDDISFDFDSLRQSFNLKRDGTFYSLTLTEGVQSSVIKPENNIIVSLNGVLQEPGVGFEIVGSRIIFSEIPRVGSTFVAFSYVGSEADVDATDVVPPIEPGDFIEIEGETEDREVAVIESSNSLITFDYLGSIFGKGAAAAAVLTSGTIDKVSVTSGGSGYTSRPNVRIDSISGFDAQIRALVGVSSVVVSNSGSGYQNPDINIETTVPDDWTAPNLADYGEEIIDPEII